MGRGHRVTHLHLSIKVTDSFQIFLSLMSHPNYAQESLNFVGSKQNHGYIYFIVNHLIFVSSVSLRLKIKCFEIFSSVNVQPAVCGSD